MLSKRYLIVTIVAVEYLNQSIRKFYFIQHEELSGEHFLHSVYRMEKQFFSYWKPKAAIEMLYVPIKLLTS